ncbi:hypothetical protein C8Q73DRAFT_688504, partial [Cubamyces lactineus]
MVVPDLRFVDAALALTDADQNSYLIEEDIPQPDRGIRWYKYINNNSAKPITYWSKKETERAKFLVFTQHLQFVVRKACADAVIRIWRALERPSDRDCRRLAPGTLFAAGNLPEMHSSFLEDHKCNTFCKHFGLPTTAELAESVKEWNKALEGPNADLPKCTHNAIQIIIPE